MSRKTVEDQVALLEQYIFGEITTKDINPQIRDMISKDFSLDPTLDKVARTRAAIVWALKQTKVPPGAETDNQQSTFPAAALNLSPAQSKKKSKKKVA